MLRRIKFVYGQAETLGTETSQSSHGSIVGSDGSMRHVF